MVSGTTLCSLSAQLSIILAAAIGVGGLNDCLGQSPATMHSNHLINETSPYLLQHAHNPVNWYPWGDEAFAKAKAEDKPIFLSIGYSTCYWCHVMEVESFEDPEVAKVINEHFVAIKVDREERPDIDDQYMLVTQLLTNRGGWPNSVWLTPDGKPWMAGTYFPKQRFVLVLEQLHQFWVNRRDDVNRQAESIVSATRRAGNPEIKQVVDLTPQLIDQATETFLKQFDPQHGGFGGAPKFPPHGTLAFLMHRHRQSKDERLLEPITKTLDAMWLGGFHDHLGGGFHRYSTDAEWLLPHFEKMLYDNAQLMGLYAEAFDITKEARYREAVADIYQWLSREMTSKEFGFYSALDSGEVGKEGEAYVWSTDQLQKTLTAPDASLFAGVYQFTEAGNFRDEASGERVGKNIPHLLEPITVDSKRLANIRQQLLDERLTWPQPHRDDKVLTSWNGLMIESLAKSARLLDEPKYLDLARSAAEFLLRTMENGDGLYRSYRDGTAKQPAYFDDYVYLANGLYEVYLASGEQRYLNESLRLVGQMQERFEDKEHGGFFQTGPEHEALLVRSKFLGAGGNLPSTNGVAACLLLNLAKETGRDELRDSAIATLEAFAVAMDREAHTNEHLLIATDRWLQTQDKSAADQSDGVVTVREKPVTATASISKASVLAGDECELRIELTIDQGFHLYAKDQESQTEDVEFVKAVAFQVQSDKSVSVGTWAMPEPTRITDAVLGKELAIYKDRVRLSVPLSIATQAIAATVMLQVTIEFQACDDKACLQPQQIKLSVPLEIKSP
ncbi:DUF255 domain-containing protein [Rhodopirellula sp. MGV]|uniref:DUF255 domain-containing protein n=1 Tax=Rhodopirellula sp. MGV TaxID=2023130 RepID=UPI00117A3984|nr:DUF255 domain-containing protein [Rhodopirellula sp. MGV]